MADPIQGNNQVNINSDSSSATKKKNELFQFVTSGWKSNKSDVKSNPSTAGGPVEQSGLGDFLRSEKGQNLVTGIGAAAKALHPEQTSTSQDAARDLIGDVATAINPAVGTAIKAVNAIQDITGMKMDKISGSDANKAGAGFANDLNNALQVLPGTSLITGTIAKLGSATAQANELSAEGEEMMGSYGGVQSDINSAKNLSGKHILFGKGKINRFIRNTNDTMDLIDDIGHTNTLRKKSTYSLDLNQQNLNRYVGTNYMAVGRNGMKLMSKKEVQELLATRKLQKGGVVGTDTNILPEGALHARLNHLQDTNPDLEDTTRKGIPVLDENGDQVAEIEGSEIVLRLELTKKIEELMKDGSDEAMIEAGKILVEEIIENTQDNTGMITEEVQNG